MQQALSVRLPCWKESSSTAAWHTLMPHHAKLAMQVAALT